jgi:glycolate oxidase
MKTLRGDGYKVQVALKNAIDPREIMNPGKLLGMKTRFGLPVGPNLLGFGMGAMATVKKLMPADKMVEQKASELEKEELEKERFKQYKNDPLKK